MAKKTRKKTLKECLNRYIKASERTNKAIANYRVAQVGFTDKMRAEILKDINK